MGKSVEGLLKSALLKPRLGWRPFAKILRVRLQIWHHHVLSFLALVKPMQPPLPLQTRSLSSLLLTGHKFSWRLHSLQEPRQPNVVPFLVLGCILVHKTKKLKSRLGQWPQIVDVQQREKHRMPRFCLLTRLQDPKDKQFLSPPPVPDMCDWEAQVPNIPHSALEDGQQNKATGGVCSPQ